MVLLEELAEQFSDPKGHAQEDKAKGTNADAFLQKSVVFREDLHLPNAVLLVARAIRNAIRANRFTRIIRN